MIFFSFPCTFLLFLLVFVFNVLLCVSIKTKKKNQIKTKPKNQPTNSKLES